MFILSNDYDRVELLNFVGSKQGQSGIIWGSKESGCVIVTSGGRGGKRAGYGDIRNNDGSIIYIGQGEKGDQTPEKFSNSLLVNGEKSILFFSTREPNANEIRERGNYKKLYRFEGIYQVLSWDFFYPTDGMRKTNKLIQFHLIPANNIFNISPTSNETKAPLKKEDINIGKLKKKLKLKNNKPTKGQLNAREYFIRSLDIINYAKARANGYCEKCNILAPFNDIFDSPYLEVHHIFRLADDGPDSPENVAAICPNCHREAHFGKEKNKIKDFLAKLILEKELTIEAN